MIRSGWRRLPVWVGRVVLTVGIAALFLSAGRLFRLAAPVPEAPDVSPAAVTAAASPAPAVPVGEADFSIGELPFEGQERRFATCEEGRAWLAGLRGCAGCAQREAGAEGWETWIELGSGEIPEAVHSGSVDCSGPGAVVRSYALRPARLAAAAGVFGADVARLPLGPLGHVPGAEHVLSMRSEPWVFQIHDVRDPALTLEGAEANLLVEGWRRVEEIGDREPDVRIFEKGATTAVLRLVRRSEGVQLVAIIEQAT